MKIINKLSAIFLILLLSVTALIGCDTDPTQTSNTGDSHGTISSPDHSDQSSGQSTDQSTDQSSGQSEEQPPHSDPLPSQGEIERKTVDMTLMSFNIRTIANEDVPVNNWSNRKDAVMTYLAGQDASVICMQEVRKQQYEDMNSFAALTEKFDIVYYARESGNDPEGLAIAFDKAIWEKQSENMFWLSETPEVMSKGWGANYYRICVNVLLKHRETGAMLNVFCVHLDHQVELARVNGMNLIIDRISRSQYPAFVAGDFNCTDDTETYKSTAEQLLDCHASLPDADKGRTFNNWTESATEEGPCIDFCFVSKRNFTPLTFNICRDKWSQQGGEYVFGENGYFLSDHYAVKTTVTLAYDVYLTAENTTDNGFDGPIDRLGR